MKNANTVDDPGLDKGQAKKTSKEGASYLTLCPYTPPSTNKNHKKVVKTLNFDDLFGPQKWTKYFEMREPVKDHFQLYNTLAAEVGSDVLFRNTKDGVCIIEAADQEQSEKLQQLVNADNPSMPIKKNESLNVCHGTIVIPNAIETGDTEFSQSSEKIKQNIRIQGYEIKNIITFVKPARGSRRYPLRIAKITFEGRTLPDTVVVAGQRLSVKEYVPAPRQCVKCWQYGHGINYCKAKCYKCPICGMEGHQKDDCTNKTNKVCINCQGNHPAFSRSCSQYKKQQLIVKTQFKEGLSYRAAINKLKQTGEITSLNYKKALEGKRPATASTPKMPIPSTSNRYNILQIEDDAQNQASPKDISEVSPKRLSKRTRDSSSEEELSPKLNPKQKTKTKEQSSKVHEVIAEIHASEISPMDDTIIYTDGDLETLDVEAEEPSSPAIVPLESASPTVLSSTAALHTDLPSKSSGTSALPSDPSVPNVSPTESPLPTVAPAGTPSTPIAPSELPSTTVTPSESPTSTIEPSELPLQTVTAALPSLSALPAAAAAAAAPPSPSALPAAAAAAAAAAAVSTSPSDLPAVTVATPPPSALPAAAVAPPSLSALPAIAPTPPSPSPALKKSQGSKITKVINSKNEKLSLSKRQSKIPAKIGTSKPYLSKVKNLVRDYHMPPGYKGGK